MENYTYGEMKEHVGHNIKLVQFDESTLSIECSDCDEILMEIDESIDVILERLDFSKLPF